MSHVQLYNRAGYYLEEGSKQGRSPEVPSDHKLCMGTPLTPAKTVFLEEDSHCW